MMLLCSRFIQLVQLFGLIALTQAFLPGGIHLMRQSSTIGSTTPSSSSSSEEGLLPAQEEPNEPETTSKPQVVVKEVTEETLPNTYVRCGKCQSVYAITPEDIGKGTAGRRLECSLCGHSWFQSKDRILTLNSDLQMVPLSQRELDRIEMNRQEGKPLGFVGDKKLYVGNIAFEAHEEDLFHVFGKFGIVGEVSLVRDETGKVRGFGFVTMRTAEGAKLAIEQADKMCIRGREVTVRESNT